MSKKVGCSKMMLVLIKGFASIVQKFQYLLSGEPLLDKRCACFNSSHLLKMNLWEDKENFSLGFYSRSDLIAHRPAFLLKKRAKNQQFNCLCDCYQNFTTNET